MSKTMLDNKLYNDTWFFNLSTEAKFLFVYLVTCKDCNLIGCYELPLPVMSMYTGIPEGHLSEVLESLNPSIRFTKGWVMVPNYEKYNPMRNPNIQKSKIDQLASLPLEILKEYETLTKGFVNPYVTLQGKEQERKLKGKETEQETETVKDWPNGGIA